MAATRTTLEILLAFKDQLSGGLIKAEKGILSFAKRGFSGIKTLLGSLLNLKTLILGVGGALAAGGAVSLVKRVADLGDKLLKTSQKTGITVENLSRLQHAAGMSGVEIDELGRSFVIAQKNIQGFRMGSAELEDVMALMGKEFEQAVLRGESLEQLLPEIIDGFNALGTEEEKVVVATKLFGKSGAELIPFLEEGRDKIEELFRESDRLRLTWSRGDAEAADTFGDALDRLKGSMFGLLQEVVKPLLPTFTKWLDAMTSFIVDHRDEVLNFFAGMVDWGKQLANQILPALQSAFADLAAVVGPFFKDFMKAGEWILNWQLDKTLSRIAAVRSKLAAPPINAPWNNPDIERRVRADLSAEIPELLAKRDSLERALSVAQSGFGEGVGAAWRERAASPLDVAPGVSGGPFSGLSSGGTNPGRKPSAEPSALKTVIDEIETMRQEWIDSSKQMGAATRQLGDSVVDNLAGGLTEAELRAKSFGEAFHEMGKGILTDLLKIINRMIVMRLLGAATTGIGALFKGSDTPSVSGSGYAPSHGMQTFAEGTPRTTGPAIAGEGPIPEAVIPLSRGRYVPVELAGNSGTTIYQTTIYAIDAKSFNERFRSGVASNREMIASVYQQQYQNRPEFRRSVR